MSVAAPPSLHLRRRSTRTALALDPARELGAGGEARVLAIPGDDSLVAKLYHEPTLAKARKVALMMADEPALDASSATLAWPRDLLTDAHGRFAGFLMERAAGPRVFEFYNPSTRRHAAPRGDYALLHRVGANVAAAFEALHARGYVIGDVNESNVLVRPGGAVTLVDTDSLQVPDRENGTVLRSRVGKAEFTPPELQGRSFADFDRSPEHDRFGLAVLLFLLLMEGTHPFAGRLEDGGEMPPIEERIRRGLFPHDDHTEIRPPRLAPDFSLLAPSLRALFVRCFEDGHADPSVRPTAAEWRAALAGAGADLRKCRKNRCHRYGAHLDACPWCARAALLGGRDPFPEKAPPPPARQPRGSNRKGSVALRSALAGAKKPAAGRGAAGARTVAVPAPTPAPGPAPVPWWLRQPQAPRWLQGVRVPPWLDPILGPSGAQHPASWVAPALAVLVLTSSWIQLLCVATLPIAASWWIIRRSRGRIGRHTVAASVGLLLMVIVLVAIARVIVPGTLFQPEPAGYFDAQPLDPADDLGQGSPPLEPAGEPEAVPDAPPSTPEPEPEPAGYADTGSPAPAGDPGQGSPPPEPAGEPGALPDARPPTLASAGATARLGFASSHDGVDAQPQLLNAAEAERALTEQLVRAGQLEGLGATVSVRVLPDGTVDPRSVGTINPANRDFALAAAPGLAAMRFRPLTKSGAPVTAVVWINVRFSR